MVLLWQEYTELYKKYLNDPDNHDGVITHLEPDILECEVKKALRSITMNKARGGDGIPVELFQILKDDAVKVNKINMPAGLENSTVASGLEKVNVHSNPKECSNYCTIAFILHGSQAMLKILEARLEQYMHHKLSDVQAGFRKGRGTRDEIAKIHRIIEKARECQKNIYFCFIHYAKGFDCVDHNKLWKIL